MKYYLDCEFDGFGGQLLSLALVSEKNDRFYAVLRDNIEPQNVKDPWVAKNILPILFSVPTDKHCDNWLINKSELPYKIQNFLIGDLNPHIISDWPDDIKYFCESLITGPGHMIKIPQVNFSVVRVDAWPNNIEGAVQHNALWDAIALKEILS